jgi:amidohydrolase
MFIPGQFLGILGRTKMRITDEMTGITDEITGITDEINGILLDAYPELVEARRRIHMYPELAFNEEKTAELVAGYLRSLGVETTTGIAKTGVVGLIRGACEGATVALRADMDALPVTEENDCGYKSRVPDAMHACGHDVHVACLLGAAKVLSKIKDKLKGNVKLIFQPAEEGVGGALPMIKEGVLENPHVDACAALHVWPDMPAGKAAVHYGTIYSARDSFEIAIKGKGGHGAMPHLAVDPIITGALVVNALYSLVNKKINALNPVVLSICTFNAGTCENIIPDKALITGTVRTVDDETKEKIPAVMEKIIAGVTEGSGTGYEFDFREGYPATINDDRITDIIVDSASKIIGADNVQICRRPIMVSEDFSFFSRSVPGTYFRLGCADNESGVSHPLHSPKFNVDEKCIITGAGILAQFAYDYLNSECSGRNRECCEPKP